MVTEALAMDAMGWSLLAGAVLSFLILFPLAVRDNPSRRNRT